MHIKNNNHIFAQKKFNNLYFFINMGNKNKQQILMVVCNSFLRVIKNYDMYHIFKKQFDARRNSSRGEGNVGGFGNLAELMLQIEQIAHKEMEMSGRMHHNQNYDNITFLINVLLRNFLEKGGVPPQKLGFYGQEIFDLTCYALYGEQYLNDMDNMNEGAPRPKNELEAYLVGEYMNRKQMGAPETWDEFLAKYASQIARIAPQFNQHSFSPLSEEMFEDFENDDDDDDDDSWF